MTSQRLTLNVKKRQAFGKKVKALRRDGLVPATIYGQKIEPLSVEINAKELDKIYQKTGETELLDLQVEGEKETRPVLIHQEQKYPVSGKLLHLEFLQVSLTEKVKAEVPLVFTGVSQAVKDGKGNLLEILHEVEIEALPQDLPAHFEVNVSDLSEVGQAIKVSDLVLPKGVIVKVDPSEFICKIVEQQKEEEKPVVAETAIPETSAETEAAATGAVSPETPEEPKVKEKKEKKDMKEKK